LSEDNRVLKIDTEIFSFRGYAQSQVIRQLYETFFTGQPKLTQVLLNDAGVNCRSIAPVFRKYPKWEILRRHIQTEKSFTWLEPRYF
jgi:hypothetical protein